MVKIFNPDICISAEPNEIFKRKVLWFFGFYPAIPAYPPFTKRKMVVQQPLSMFIRCFWWRVTGKLNVKNIRTNELIIN